MIDLVFFYGTLMSALAGIERPRLNPMLRRVGRGSIAATLFDLGAYPAAIPSLADRVWGEVHRMLDTDVVLEALDEFEGFAPSRRRGSLYTRDTASVTMSGGEIVAWTYFYNGPLARAERIQSGDYLEYLAARQSRRAAPCRRGGHAR